MPLPPPPLPPPLPLLALQTQLRPPPPLPPPTPRASPPCCGCRSDRSLIEGFALKYLGILRCCRRTVTIGELSTEIPLSSLQSTPSFDFKPLPLFLPLNFAPGGPDATLGWFVQKRRARAWCSPRQHVKKMEKGRLCHCEDTLKMTICRPILCLPWCSTSKVHLRSIFVTTEGRGLLTSALFWRIFRQLHHSTLSNPLHPTPETTNA